VGVEFLEGLGFCMLKMKTNMKKKTMEDCVWVCVSVMCVF